MAQALEKRIMSPKQRKSFFAQKSFIFQNSVIDQSLFSQKSLINRKIEPQFLRQQVLVQQTPKVLSCY